MPAAKDVVPLHTRVRDTSLHLETPAVVFQEYPAASSSGSFLHEEDSRAWGGCQWQGLALLQHPGPPASSLVWGPRWSAAASLWLRRLSSEFEALAARWQVGICGWNSSANFYKEFIYVYCIFCAGLYKDGMNGISVVLSISLHDFSDVGKIAFVPSNGNNNARGAMLAELSHPVLQCWKCLFFCDIINDDGCCWPSIVHRCQRTKSFLSSCIPD